MNCCFYYCCYDDDEYFPWNLWDKNNCASYLCCLVTIPWQICRCCIKGCRHNANKPRFYRHCEYEFLKYN